MLQFSDFCLMLIAQTTLACLSTKSPEITDCSTCPSPYSCGSYSSSNCLAETVTNPAPYAMVKKVGGQCEYHLVCPPMGMSYRVKVDRGGGFVNNVPAATTTLECLENFGGVWTDGMGTVVKVACANA